MASLKLIFSENNIRRLKLTHLPSYPEFIQNITEIYPSHFCREKKFILKYIDNDGDKIGVSTQLEWEEMLNQLSSQNILKIYIEDTEEKLSETEISINPNSSEEEGVFEGVMKQLQECVEKVESELKDHVENGLKSFDENVIQNVKNTVINVIEEVPYDPNTLYLLACAESLLGNVKGGIETLEKAINNGFRDIHRLVNDVELENIKDSLAFSQIVQKLERILNPDMGGDVLGVSSDEVVVEPVVESLEVKVNKLAEVCEGLPKDLLRDLLVECHEDTDEVMSLIYSTFKF